MKQTPKLFLLLLILSISLSCSEDNENSVENSSIEESTDLATAPKVLISLEDALTMMNEYNEDPTVKSSTTEPHFVDFEFSELKQYIAFIEQQSKEANVDIEALRFYFGKHPSQYPSGKVSKDANKKSLFYNPVASFPGLEGNMSYAIKTDENGQKTAVTIGSVIDSSTEKNASNNILTLVGDEVVWPPPPRAGDPNDFH